MSLYSICLCFPSNLFHFGPSDFWEKTIDPILSWRTHNVISPPAWGANRLASVEWTSYSDSSDEWMTGLPGITVVKSQRWSSASQFLKALFQLLNFFQRQPRTHIIGGSLTDGSYHSIKCRLGICTSLLFLNCPRFSLEWGWWHAARASCSCVFFTKYKSDTLTKWN